MNLSLYSTALRYFESQAKSYEQAAGILDDFYTLKESDDLGAAYFIIAAYKQMDEYLEGAYFG